MKQIKITQVKSLIGRTQDQRRTVRSLGLRRISDSVVKNDTPEVRGMIKSVAHLVKTEEVSK